jgi:DNA helicase-2/ATP-dependent DNA helicase PcrA
MSKKTSKFPPKKPDNSHIIKHNVKHNWSEYQKNIFKNIAQEKGHLVVEAYAGSAKTSSIIESFKYVPKGKKSLVLAFNKIIQEEMKARAPSYISDILTFHSLGFRAIKQRFGVVELDDYKVSNLVKEQLGKDTNYDLIDNISNTVAFCKYGLQDAPNQVDEIIYNFGIDLCEMDRKQFISLVIKTLGLDKLMTSKIDFNDMCWMPFVYNLPLGQFDYVFVDESQDLNKSQLVMAKKACKVEDGRIIMVLDPYQALYSWRMADTSVLADLKKQEGTKTLPLPISYRCPKQIIGLANL